MRKIDRQRRAEKMQRLAVQRERYDAKARVRAEREAQRRQHALQLAAASAPRFVDGRPCRILVADEGRVRTSVSRYERFFGREWLEKDEAHPARTLWTRRDESATGELVMWGNTLERVEPIVSPAMLKRWQASAKRADANDSLGALFEVFAAGLFQHRKHPVLDPDDRRPGFDLLLDVGESRRVQLSLKNLLPSDYERDLRAFAKKLRNDLKSRLPRDARVSLRAFTRAPDPLQFLDSTRDTLVTAVVAGVAAQQHRLPDIGPWSVLIDDLAPLHGNEFSDNGPSFSLVLAVLHKQNENQRVASNAIDKACAKFRDHCSRPDPGVANVFLIKIPTSVNVTEARAAIVDAFCRPANACIAAGYLYRASWLTRDGGATFYIGHEIYEEKNPNATPSLDHVCPKLSLEVPFGRVQSETPTQEVHIEDESPAHKTYVLDGEHAVLVGSHVYRWPSKGLVARHGIEVMLDRDGSRESLVSGHDDRLVLL